MAAWELAGESGLIELYASLPAAYFQKERWFADRELAGEIELVDSARFYEPGQADPVIALNLYRIKPFAGYYYYIPFLISQSRNREREAFFEKNGFYFYDAVSTGEYVSLVEELLRHQASYTASRGVFQFQSFRTLSEPRLRLMGGTSNSLLFVTRAYLLKNYRRIYPGTNPELKISAALTELGSKQIPEIYGFFNYRDQEDHTLGIVMETVENSGAGWERWGRLLRNNSPETGELLREEARQLGRALGYLHRDLADISRRAGGYSELDLTDIERRIDGLIGEIKADRSCFLEFDSILGKLNDFKERLTAGKLGAKFRIHGDLHLEQVVKTDTGWRILDFEGEPLKSIQEREQYDSPLKDLAALLRSISYRIQGVGTGRNRSELEEKIGSGLIEGYLGWCREVKADFLPGPDELGFLLTLFQIERAVYECVYESKYRPDWLWIPRTGLKKLMGCDLPSL